MARTLADLRSQTLIRLGDTEEAIWSADEIDGYLRDGYDILAREHRVFYDWLYSENLPSGFSYTAPWELALIEARAGFFDFGCANYTMDDERLMLDDDEADRVGPAWYTCPSEALDGLLDDVSANVTISATDELPDSVAGLERLTWDNRAMTALTPRDIRARDSRYELQAGEVYGYLWQQDGVRTLRKVRIPAQQGDTYTVNGDWGILRDPSDLSTEAVTPTGTSGNGFSATALWEVAYVPIPSASLGVTTYTSAFEASEFQAAFSSRIGPCFYTAVWEVTGGFVARLGLTITVSQQWGIPRQISGQHPMGSDSFGTPRRVYQDGKNVRVEHWRQGRPLEADRDVCELPTRYADYLLVYAQWQAFTRPSAGQDLTLAQHYQQRWLRNVARIVRRTRRVDRERTLTLTSGVSAQQSAAPPSYQWPFASQVR